MKLTKKMKNKIYEAGQQDEYAYEILTENADRYLDEQYPNLTDDDHQLAIEVYCDGFFNAPKTAKSLIGFIESDALNNEELQKLWDYFLKEKTLVGGQIVNQK